MSATEERQPYSGSDAITESWEAEAGATLIAALPTGALRGNVLVAELGEGGLGAAVKAGATAERLMLVDGDAERLERARRRVGGSRTTFFAQASIDALPFADGVFDAAVCARSLVTTADAFNAATGIARRVREGGWVALAAVGSRSLRSVAERVLAAADACGEAGVAAAVRDHEARRVTLDDLRAAAQAAGVAVEDAGTREIAVAAPPVAVLMSGIVASELAPMWRHADSGFRPLGTTVGDALARLRTELADGVEDTIELVWLVGRVDGEEELLVDEADIEEVLDA